MPPDLNLEKAKNYAFLLLKFRPRSEKEIFFRLKKKKFDDHVIRETLSFLKEKNFINDVDFARTWITSRIKKPLGLRRLKQELNLKGINKEVIDNAIAGVKENYNEEDVVEKIVREKFKKLRGVDPKKARARIYGYLLRRGFSPQVIIEAMGKKGSGAFL